MKRFLITLGLILVTALALAACSGAGSTSSSATVISATLSDFKFEPASWEVPAGKQVEIDLTNSGSVQHNWTLMAKPVSGSYSQANQADVLFTKQVAAGASDKGTFTAPATPGNYQVICDISGHFEAGMVGNLVVK